MTRETAIEAATRETVSGIVDLQDVAEESRFGGKAASLGFALREGLPVPPGFALDVATVEAIVRGDGAALALLAEHVGRLGGPVAVRSSAVGEDSAGASFAGRHETVLGVVGAHAVARAIARVRDSGRSKAAFEYRTRLGLEAAPRVAVAVQRMLDADLAGVVFTRHPLTGASELVIEAVRGLGETLVAGRATPVRYRLDREGNRLEVEPGEQAVALRLGPDGSVAEKALADPTLPEGTLDARQLAELATLARRCEEVYGAPQDVEWAVASSRPYLLQSRPITIAGPIGIDPARANLLHGDPGAGILWSRVNVGEAMPGTVTPLTREFHRDSCEVTPQRMWRRLGVFPAGPERRPQTPEEFPTQFLCGKACANVDYLRAVVDTIPGTSGDAFEEGMLGRVRPGVTSQPRRGRYPIVAAKLATIIAVLPREFEKLSDDTHAWWRDRTREAGDTDLSRAVEIFDDACRTNARVTEGQGLIAMLSSGFWDPVARIVRAVGTQEDLLVLTAGYGNIREARMLEMLWEVSRGRAGLGEFLARYGYMGPLGGELASPSWRENPAPLEPIVRSYANLPDEQSPAERQRRTRRAFEATRERILAAAGFAQRAALRIALRLAARMLPLREVGKAAMLRSSDVARAAVRRVGILLAERGDIDHPGDALYLSHAHLRAGAKNVRDLRRHVRALRELRERYARIDLPDFFTSEELRQILRRALDAPATPQAAGARDAATLVRGMGVSRGRVEGTARLVADPSRVACFEAGDVLVCHTTDPGWAGLFSIAGAMVVDVGGMLSHSAIIARELGIPAVVNTRDGTSRISDGARVVVDGSTGEVVLRTDDDVHRSSAWTFTDPTTSPTSRPTSPTGRNRSS